uniref:Glycosyltransferase n=1 Tax=viral metagenome TaxID=1070528 RepID=A0A6C0BQV1_9ZZZZ
MPRRILFVTQQDCANVNTKISQAINDLGCGWESRVCSCVSHPFKYHLKHDLDYDESTETEKAQMREWIQQGIDVLVWAEEAHTQSYYSYYARYPLFRQTMLMGAKPKMRVIFHTGTYRGEHKKYNELDRLNFTLQLLSPDLWRLSTHSHPRIIWGKPIKVDVDYVRYWWTRRRRSNKVRICHCPTNRVHKGTDIIEKGMQELCKQYPQVEFKLLQPMDHKQLERARANFHIYLDQYSASVGGVGMSSFEAMSEGLIAASTTHMIPKHLWPRPCPLIQLPCPTGDEKVDTLALVRVLKPYVQLTMKQLENRAWLGTQWVHQVLKPSTFAWKFLRELGCVRPAPCRENRKTL